MEHAAKVCRKNWRIWENLITLYLESNDFIKVVTSIKQLIFLNKSDRINVQLMLKVANWFINKYIKSNQSEEIVYRNKGILFELFDRVLSIFPTDTGILKLYWRLTQSMEPLEFKKIMDLKLREIKSLQTSGWEYDLEQGPKILKSINELKDYMGDKLEFHEEVKNFVRDTLEIIQQNNT